MLNGKYNRWLYLRLWPGLYLCKYMCLCMCVYVYLKLYHDGLQNAKKRKKKCEQDGEEEERAGWTTSANERDITI